MKKKLAEVIVNLKARSLPETLEYLIPEEFEEQIKKGSLVLVPLRNRQVAGFVSHLKSHSRLSSHQPIKAVVNKEFLPGRAFLLAEWLSNYYLEPYHLAFRLFLPPAEFIKTEAYLSWTGKPFPQEEKIAFLEQIFVQKKRVKEKEIIRKNGNQLKNRTLDRLLKIEVLKREFVFKEPEKRIKREKWLKFKEGSLENIKKLGESELALYLFLSETIEIPFKEVKKEGFTLKEVKKLLQEGLAEEFYLAPQSLMEMSFPEKSREVKLNPHQEKCLAEIKKAIKAGKTEAFLLEGVTGSGKTEVYLQAIQECLKKGKNAILLVPEIALTPQIASRVRERFGNQVALLHSQLTPANRFAQWQAIKKGDVRIVVGPRSALFSPLPDIGLIILDEEHENSYKQNTSPRYHAREVAFKLAEMEKSVLILGSATPSFESKYLAREGKIKTLKLPFRARGELKPKIEVVNLSQEKGAFLSEKLKEKIKKNLGKERKVLLFLNRRGFSPFIICQDCGRGLTCPNCSVSLVYHLKRQLLLCHHCNYKTKPPSTCPHCESSNFKMLGLGTEKIEEEIKASFPGLPVIRMDRDTTRGKDAHRRRLSEFFHLKKGFLLGTQMIAKGLDFSDIGLVGVVNADVGLNLPDFRAFERSFQTLTQVAGRAGRKEGESGEVVIQTHFPQSEVIKAFLHQDYSSFFEKELKSRKELNYPPFTRLINLVAFSKNAQTGLKELEKIRQSLEKSFPMVLGPSPCPIERIKGWFRHHLLIKYFPEEEEEIKSELKKLVKFPSSPDFRLIIDVDPVSLL